MPWKLVEVDDTPANEELLTDSELIGISIFLKVSDTRQRHVRRGDA